ncbi:iron-containing alcohol dehydrogenase [Longirhabdus pacifica]|uniref:iron-containing alcohol dehydrogenase n=1 Tax=Longirhabdus pacifica TaxID=2305227 RepID=UPI001008F377|nr:iron-containing alcohol dehydrogenase [Longirhabdus pacifica]
MTLTYNQFGQRTAIHSGTGTRAMIPELFRGLHAKRIVLFSDAGLQSAGIVDKIASLFDLPKQQHGPELVGIYLDIQQDASSECVNAAARYAREVGADALLAVGGGSVLDAVKGVKYCLAKGITDIKSIITGGILVENWPQAQPMSIPHVAVPTTAGTGSEVSPIAVIYNEQLKIKSNIIHPFINADMAVLDPDLTVGLPPFITAFTGFDALTHAIEALASPKATVLTDAYALHAIRIISKQLPAVVKDGAYLPARMEMLQASLIAITAFSFALNAIPVHNFAHAYGALFRIPHGLANAVFLPEVMEHIPQLYLPKSFELAQALGIDTNGKQREHLLKDSVHKIKELQQQVDLPADFRDYNINASQLEATIKAVSKDPAARSFPIPAETIQTIGMKVIFNKNEVLTST